MERKFKSTIKDKNDNPTFGKINEKPKEFNTNMATIKEKDSKIKN